MTATLGSRWDVDRTMRTVVGMLIALVGLCLVAPAAASGLARAAGAPTPVIVRTAPGQTGAAEQAVRELGGQVGQRIAIIDGFSATVPASGLAALEAQPGVTEVSPNARVRLMGSTYDPTADVGSLYNTTILTGAQDYWGKGFTGAGVDVALIDSGVAPVEGLTTPGKVLNGPDLSFDSQASNLLYLDGYGHGTHMAGIIAGRDDAAVPGKYQGDKTDFIGMAPDARIVNVKVADNQGATDVSQVIAAIDWVVQHRSDAGMNIRVLNLSFGTDSTQSYTLDPLAYAAEVAWKAGIVVVASVGNDGSTGTGVADPAIDPYVLAVGAADTRGTTSTSDDQPATFSSWGDGVRNPDMLAPGVHIAGLRVPGSAIDQAWGGTASVATRFFRGSGSSQAAAVMSGAAALAVQQHPTWTPDEIKQLLVSTSQNLNAPAKAVNEGRGEVNLKHALGTGVGSFTQKYTGSTGTGSLEQARGSLHVTSATGVTLTGEQDIMGTAFGAASMAALEASGQSWSSGTWNGQSWSGQSWSGQSWSGQSWSGQSWSGQSWSGQSWSGQSWSGQSWSGQSWSGQSWSGQSWSGQSWSGQSWSGQSWSGQSWSNDDWS